MGSAPAASSWRSANAWTRPLALETSGFCGIRRSSSRPERPADRSAELRASIAASMERNPPTGARSAPDGGGNRERRATTRTSPCLFPGSILDMALNVADHVLLVDLAQGGGAAGAHLVHEPADDREMADDAQSSPPRSGPSP